MQNEIKTVLGENIKFFNGAPNLAIHLKDVLSNNNLFDSNNGNIDFIDSQGLESKKTRF